MSGCISFIIIIICNYLSLIYTIAFLTVANVLVCILRNYLLSLIIKLNVGTTFPEGGEYVTGSD